MTQHSNIKKIQLKKKSTDDYVVTFKEWFSSLNQCIDNTNTLMNSDFTKNGSAYFNSDGTGLKAVNMVIVDGDLKLDRIIFSDSTTTSVSGLTKEEALAHINSTGASVHNITMKTIGLDKLGKEEDLKAFFEKPMSDETEQLYIERVSSTKNGYIINSSLLKNDEYLTNVGAIIDYMPTFLDNFRDRAYPVGTYYMNASNGKNPSDTSLLGFGTWSLVNTTCTLMSSGSDYPSGSIGGSNVETLSLDNMPQHNHTISIIDYGTHTHGRGTLEATGSMWGNRFGSAGNMGVEGCFSGSEINAGDVGAGNSQGNSVRIRFTGANNWTGSTSSAGGHSHTVSLANQSSGGTAFNIMKPYLVVYIWRRTA